MLRRHDLSIDNSRLAGFAPATCAVSRRCFLGIALVPFVAGPAAAGPPALPDSFTVPLELQPEGHLLIPVSINGDPASAVVDSGASVTVVDLSFANKIGLKLGRRGRATGIAGKVPAWLAHAQLEIGGRPLDIRFLVVIDLAAINTFEARPVQLILGRDLFEGNVVEIDFAATLMHMTPRRSFTNPGDPPLPLSRAGGLPSVPVALNGIPAAATFDLGAAAPLLMDRAFVERNRLFAGRRSSTRMITAADGARDAIISTLDEVTLGGTIFRDVPALAAADLDGKTPATVGIDLLSRFRLTIDFGGKRLWMRPYPGAADGPFAKDRSGLSLRAERDRLIVAHVAGGSPASLDGWHVGDVVTAINGRAVGADFRSGPFFRWGFGPAGEKYAFSMADGSKRTIVLADYY
jgi:predicted aspartyl protease